MNHIDSLQSETTILDNTTERTKSYQNNDYSCRISNLTMTGHKEFQKGKNILMFFKFNFLKPLFITTWERKKQFP